MLYIGTTHHLEELDESYTIALDVSVTAIATRAGHASFVLLDGERIARIGDLEVSPLCRLPGPAGQSLALAPTGDLLVGSEGAHLAVVSGEGSQSPIASFDAVAGREAWENPAASMPDLRAIAVDDSGAWYAAVHVGGLWRSTDEGASWAELIEPAADVHEVAAGENGVLCVAAAGGFGWSRDGGDNWEWTSKGLHAAYCRAVAVSGETVYVSSSTGPRTTDGRLYRARLGEPFEACGNGLPASFPFNIESGTLAAAGDEVALGTRAGNAYRSSDRGASWQQVAAEMHPVSSLRFA